MEIIVDNEIFNTETSSFIVKEIDDFTRYLKGKYSNNLDRCKGRLINPLVNKLNQKGQLNFIPTVNQIVDYWDYVQSYSYSEAFQITERRFRAHVFSSINIKDMIDNLGAKRIKTEGIELINKIYNEYTNSFTNEPYSYVAELHEVNGTKLGISDNIYVVKVWCTSTNEEHWLWVDEENCNISSPLDAIASTCIIYKSMVGKIKHIIRQGDIFLFEMKNDGILLDPNDEIVRLPKEEYFSLLKSQA